MERAWLILALVVASTAVGLMGTDLVLPAVPSLPAALGGDAPAAQLVLAAYAAGTCLGLLAFGSLSQSLSTRLLFVASLAATALLSFACSLSPGIWTLVALRALQGAVAAGPAVFAPGIVKALFDETRGVRALGLLGSFESLAPALAPILGAWLLAIGGWQLSFQVLAARSAGLALAVLAASKVPQVGRRARGSYLHLLRSRVFLRYALSQAFLLGGLLTFVFGMPAVFVHALGGTLTDFIAMQVTGVAAFILAANLSGAATTRVGAEALIGFGTAMAAIGAAAQLAYALAGGSNTAAIVALFVPVNAGLGLRGPPGFYRAVLASGGDDGRGSALVILFILAAAAFGTAAASPLIDNGPVPLAAIAFLLQLAGVASLALLPRLPDRQPDEIEIVAS